jgi:hypothetical protein
MIVDTTGSISPTAIAEFQHEIANVQKQTYKVNLETNAEFLDPDWAEYDAGCMYADDDDYLENDSVD